MDVFIRDGITEGSLQSGNVNNAVESIKKNLSNIPLRTLTLFYAGLMENHGLSKADAKELLKKYLKESGKSYIDVQNELIAIVEEDNFFELIGLDKVFKTQESNTKENKNEELGESTSTKQ